MMDTILSFYKAGACPFVEAALFMAGHEEELTYRVEEDQGSPPEGDPTLWVVPTAKAKAYDGDIRHLKKPIIWFLTADWRDKDAERLLKRARAHLVDAISEPDDPGADLLLEENIKRAPALRAEESACMDAIDQATNESKSLTELRQAVAGYINFYLRVQEQLENTRTQDEEVPA